MAEQRKILDLFAGAGGWEEELRALGHRALGIENDSTASATAEAAGHERLIGDVAALDPDDFAPVWGLIASPPCQAYSCAGNRLGKLDRRRVIACARDLAAGHDTRASRLRACEDKRSLLTVEPLRFALALRPRWVTLEQVPPVVELWSLFAELLGAHGYRSAVGVLSAERYGVPQVRKRAFLIASLDGPVELPEPTHRSFESRRHRTPEGELHLPQWVSMAQALGWGSEPAVLRSNHTNAGRHPGGAPRSLDRPAFTLMSSSRGWRIEALPAASSSDAASQRRERRPAACRRHEASRVREAVAAARRPRPVWITVEQATILQSFRHDYPWQGSRLQRFRQLGDTVCPPLARRVLREAMRPCIERGGDRR